MKLVRIAIGKGDFFRQIEWRRTADTFGDVPAVIFMEGLLVQEDEMGNDKVYQEHQAFSEKLSKIEYKIFRDLYDNQDQMMSPIHLAVHLKNPQSGDDNTIRVHIYSIRKKLKKYDMPLDIERVGSRLRQYGYKLVKTK